MEKIFLVGRSFGWLGKISTTILLSFILIACGETPDEEGGNETVAGIIFSNNVIQNASWNSGSSQLTINGVALAGDTRVEIFNVDSANVRTFIGSSSSVQANGSWSWAAPLASSDKVPCRVYVSSGGAYETSAVSNAPANCGLAYSGNQQTQSADQPPQGSIVIPVSNIDVLKGSSVTFNGIATDPDGDTNLSYIWDFGSYTTRKVGQSTTVDFNRPGVVTAKLMVRDSTRKYDPTPDTVVITVLDNIVNNSAPNGTIVSPSTNRSINVGDSVLFSGSATDIDGNSVSYLWNFGASGIASSSRQNPGSKVFNRAGTYVVSLTATDNQGLSDPTPDRVTITVNAQNNRAPNGSINSPGGSRNINVGQSLFFDGSGSDPDGDPITYSWSFGASGIPSSISKTPGSLTFNRAGTFTVNLRVTDNKNLSDPTPASINVTVNAQNNNAPNGTIVRPNSNRSINVGDSISFSGSATDPDDDRVSYSWDFGGSGIASSSRRSPGSKVFNRAGTYVVSLTATDSRNLSDPTPARVTVTVNAQNNRAPNGNINSPGGSRTIEVGQSIFFDGGGSDPDGDAISYLWNFGASGVTASTSKTPGSVRFDRAGTFEVSLTVTDSKGLSDSTPSRTTVTVNGNTTNSLPNGTIITPTGSSIDVLQGSSLAFAAAGTDPDGDTNLLYIWDFGSYMLRKVGKNINVSFNQIGTVNVSLMVRDSTGKYDPTRDTITINVLDQIVNNDNQAPFGNIDSPSRARTIDAGQAVSFAGSGGDADGDLVTYLWDFDSAGTPNSTAKNPGAVIFYEPGSHLVTLTVTDAFGLADPTPATVRIEVNDVQTPRLNTPPESTINVPSTNVTISAGETVYFSGSATDVENDSPFNYFWNFDGAVPNSSMQNPGAIMFSSPGVYRVTLRSTDKFGLSDPTPAVRIVTVNGSGFGSAPNSFINSPIGNQTIAVGDTLNFSGSGSDPDGDTPFDYFWNFDGVTLNSLERRPGDITFNNAGVYNISLRVTDDTGAKDPTPASVQVTVTNFNSVNEPPNSVIITPSMDIVIFEGDSVTFRGTGSDPDNDVISYYWDFGFAAPNSTANNPGDVQFSQVGTYSISLTTTDSSGLSDPTPARVSVTVRPTPSSIAPDGRIISPATTFMSISEGDVVNFMGDGTALGGDGSLAYLWNFDGAAPHVRAQSPGNLTFANAGTYRVRLSVTDSTGLTDPTPAEVVIVVDAVNTPTNNVAPNGVINSPSSNTVVTVGETLNFTASGYDADGDLPLSYRWNFGGVIPNTSAKDPGLITFNQVGTYRVVLTATDSAGISDPTPMERLITVVGINQNQAPTASILAPLGNQNIDVNDIVSFSGTGFDADNNTPLIYMWDFDGAVPNVVGANPGNVTFKRAGTFVVTLTVVDSLGAVSVAQSRTITVSEGGNNTGTGGGDANWSILNPVTDTLVLNKGASYTFNGALTGLNGERSSFQFWNLNGYSFNPTGTTATITFDRVGTVIIDYKVKDASGAWVGTFDTVTVYVQ